MSGEGEKKDDDAAEARPPAIPIPTRAADDIEAEGKEPDAIFQTLWKRVIEAWDDDKPHQAALAYAISNDMLPEIAGRYRKLMDDPEKSARAKKKIDGIVMAATQMLLATKTPPREKVPWQWTAMAAVFMVVVLAFLAVKILGHR